MNLISHCCGKPVVDGRETEYPLGGSTWGIHYKITVCEECGKETDPVESCDICGEPAEKFVHLDGDDYCPHCFEERLQEAIHDLKQRTGLGDKTA